MLPIDLNSGAHSRYKRNLTHDLNMRELIQIMHLKIVDIVVKTFQENMKCLI